MLSQQRKSNQKLRTAKVRHGDRKSEAGMVSKDVLASPKHDDNRPAAEEVAALSHLHSRMDSELKDENDDL